MKIIQEADFEKLDVDPEDKHNIMYLVFILYGAATLMPWNVVTCCFDYFLLFDA